ncbi:MAG: HEAT repeat domain-containing protein [Candidatus Marinimicrobia bacterium]|nr:HEAT repeat domain-containing protein [Candidatus Neomarinimicrobiota bacterium]MCH7763630.1 HEAT repeat domain-containing protein [Candidatus Neomarinimicrobiota bacterium]
MLDWLRQDSELPFHVELTLQVIIVTIAIIIIFTLILSFIVIGLRIKNIQKEKHWQKLERKWERLIFDIMANELEAEQIWATVHPRERLYFLQYLLRFARRVRGEEFNTIKSMAKPYLYLLESRVKKGPPELRARAVQTLGVLGFPDYIQPVIEALDDPAPIVSMLAARALARKEYPDNVRFILPIIHRFENWSMSYLSALLALFGEGASSYLRATLADPTQDNMVRTACSDALKKLMDLKSADVANEVINSEKDPELLASLLRLLRSTGRKEHLDTVRSMIDSPEFIVRANAYSTLGFLGVETDRKCLIKGIEDNNTWVAIHAARALMKLGGQTQLEKIALSNRSRSHLVQQVISEG